MGLINVGFLTRQECAFKIFSMPKCSSAYRGMAGMNTVKLLLLGAWV